MAATGAERLESIHMRYQWYGKTLCGIECDIQNRKPRFTSEIRLVNCKACHIRHDKDKEREKQPRVAWS